MIDRDFVLKNVAVLSMSTNMYSCALLWFSLLHKFSIIHSNKKLFDLGEVLNPLLAYVGRHDTSSIPNGKVWINQL